MGRPAPWSWFVAALLLSGVAPGRTPHCAVAPYCSILGEKLQGWVQEAQHQPEPRNARRRISLSRRPHAATSSARHGATGSRGFPRPKADGCALRAVTGLQASGMPPTREPSEVPSLRLPAHRLLERGRPQHRQPAAAGEGGEVVAVGEEATNVTALPMPSPNSRSVATSRRWLATIKSDR